MGDYGRFYPTYTLNMCRKLKNIVKYADIITPNITEACLLTDSAYHEKWPAQELNALAVKLCGMGPEKL